MSYIKKYSIILVVVLWAVSFNSGFAQLPQDLPNDPQPVDFSSPANIILYIVTPVVLILIYLLLRIRHRRNK